MEVKSIKLFAYGVIVVILYGLLFAYENEIVQICTRGGWWFLFPVAVAFVFSIFHGTFTGLFWEALGVQARKSR
jgi:hypothetical protein